jgi:EAL domain-containing protein (putative c-di-GMP-specific phosphodiesterase class I)
MISDQIKVEPIVTLSGQNIRHIEMLCASTLPKTEKAWQLFYEHACQQSLSRHDCAINVDSDHIMDDKIFKYLLNANKSITAIEWTERASEGPFSVDDVAERLNELRHKRGFEIHLDDVGSGDDPLVKSLLTRPDVIKIDGELFHRARNNANARLILAMHIKCYKEMLSDVVVEWVESSSDIELAREIGADFAQGFYFNKVKL